MFRLLPGIFDIVPIRRKKDGEVNSPLQNRERLLWRDEIIGLRGGGSAWLLELRAS
jgi:hypothetical protein